MKKNLKKIMLFMLLLLIGKTVYAETAMVEMDYFYDDQGNEVYKNIDGEASRFMDITVNDTKAYCLEVGRSLYMETPHNTSQTLLDFLKDALGDTKGTEVYKKLNEYMYFGYGYNNQSGFKYAIATQKMIWDELYNAGYRTDAYSLNISFYGGTSDNIIDVSSEVNTIKNNITTYYKTPSFCSSSQQSEIAVGESETFTDTNGVLSKYTVTCGEGIKCETNENELKITAISTEGDKTIIFSKAGVEPTTLLYTEASQQAVVTGHGGLAPVSCQFGVDTFENVKTGSAKILLVSFIAMASLATVYIILAIKPKKQVD